MKKISKIFLAMLLAGTAIAQADLKLPIKSMGDESFYYYKVKKNESVQGVANKIGVSVDDLIKYNPSANHGITKGQLLFFPVDAYSSQASKAATQVSVSKKHVTHVVKKGESLYGVAKLYGLTVDQLIQANPSANNGVQNGDVLTIPGASTADLGSNVIYHTIEQGESLWGVAKTFNTTIERLLELNPGIYPNNFVAGDVIKVQPNTAANITIAKDITQFTPYVCKQGDTYASVARAQGVGLKELQQANPDMKTLKKGKTIYIPRQGQSVEQVNSSKASAKELEQTYKPKLEQVYNDVHQNKPSSEVNIAVVLPFQLHKEDPPRQAYLYTDFAKGLLLAADSIGNTIGKKVNVNLWDTEHNLNVTDSLLALPAMKQQSLIIAPSEPKQLKRINDFGKRNGITVINTFSPSSEDYTSNSQVLQVNMPTSYMTAAVNEWIDGKFKGYSVIFLSEAGDSDKDIYTDIQEHITASNMHHQEITVTSALTYTDLSQRMDPGVKYLIIPTSGSRKLLSHVAAAVKEAKEKRFDCEITMLGFPQYLTYLNEYKSTFQAIDTYIFSRFFIANERRAAKVRSKFARQYGSEAINTTPSMMLMGFDLGMYVLTTLGSNNGFNTDTPYYDGIQTDYELRRASNWGGLINRCVELVHLSGDTMSESIIK